MHMRSNRGEGAQGARPLNNFGGGGNIAFAPPPPSNPPTFSFSVHVKQLKLDHKSTNVIYVPKGGGGSPSPPHPKKKIVEGANIAFAPPYPPNNPPTFSFSVHVNSV